MKLTPKEEKITRLALHKAAKDGERAAAALKVGSKSDIVTLDAAFRYAVDTLFDEIEDATGG